MISFLAYLTLSEQKYFTHVRNCLSEEYLTASVEVQMNFAHSLHNFCRVKMNVQ